MFEIDGDPEDFPQGNDDSDYNMNKDNESDVFA
jgi:hypothetical protein